MPTYEYECQYCGHHFERFQSITAGTLRKCPACGRLGLRRLLGTGAGVIFKGSGFYETDYRRNNHGKRTEKKHSSGESPSPAESGRSKSGQADSGAESTKKDAAGGGG
ncbi:MAG: hypothetical protein B1H04_00040 [Planctomycetales bacterium 4484_123]|nr:MAG: hypothetical protein B1H04_00040 [Planctomycetales bacterium 4484_123]